MLRSLGAIVGSSISFSLNIDETKPVGVSNAVYIIFVVVHSSAFFTAMIFIIHPKDVVRKDGTHIAVFKDSHVWFEVKQTVKLMTTRKYLIMAPAQLGCEMGLALVSSVNGTSTLPPVSHKTIAELYHSPRLQPPHPLRQQLCLSSDPNVYARPARLYPR